MKKIIPIFIGLLIAVSSCAQQKSEKTESQQPATTEETVGCADGNVAPEIILDDINGKELRLSSLRGKYVVLDFWGSWCGWCIRGIPHMKEYYTKYAGKFEILGIDCGDAEETWKAAVKQHELPWLHVYNPRLSNVCATYQIQGYPTKVIIDPEGRIAKTIIGESPEFYEFLDSLFQ